MKLFTDGNEVHIAVSPQSLSSLTNYFGTESDHDTFDKLSAIFKMIGAKEVGSPARRRTLTTQSAPGPGVLDLVAVS